MYSYDAVDHTSVDKGLSEDENEAQEEGTNEEEEALANEIVNNNVLFQIVHLLL